LLTAILCLPYLHYLSHYCKTDRCRRILELKVSKLKHFGFVDLIKPFHGVPREMINWAMRKLGLEEGLVLAVMSTYTGAKTVVRTVYGNSKGFGVKSRYASRFSIKSTMICDHHGRECRVTLPWKLL